MAATLNPWLLVEIFSESNNNEAFCDKLRCHKQIPSLKYLLVIAADWMMVSAYTRTDQPNQWLNVDYGRPDQTVPVADFAIPMADLYRNIKLAE